MSTYIWLFAAVTGVVLVALVSNHRTRFDDAARIRTGSKRPFGHGEEGR